MFFGQEDTELRKKDFFSDNNVHNLVLKRTHESFKISEVSGTRSQNARRSIIHSQKLTAFSAVVSKTAFFEHGYMTLLK